MAALLVVCALVAAIRPVGNAQTEQKGVLVLHGLRRDAPVSTALDGTIQSVLNDGLEGRLDYHAEYLDVTRFPEPEYQLAVRDFLKKKYAGQTFDVVVATSDATTDFVQAYRDEICPGAAIVFDVSRPRSAPNSTGVVTGFDAKSTIDVALQLHPDLRHVYVVSGISDYDRAFEDQARAQFRAFDGRLDFTYTSGLAAPSLLRQLTDLPPHTIIFFLTFFEDAQARRFIPFDFFKQVAAAANAPIYHWTDIAMGYGMVGGRVRSTELTARATANVALRVLKGEPPVSIPVRDSNASVLQFDWRQLQRWRIDESRLPPGSLVNFREPSLWERYKLYVAGATSVAVLQSALIAGLLVQRARRRRVEGALRESEARFRVMADTAPVMVWRSGTDKGCDFFNLPWLEFRGRTMDQELAAGWTEGIHRADLEMCLATYSEAFDERRPFRMEYRLQRADGEYRWVLDSGVPRFGPDGAFAGFIGSCFDITERRQAEAELRESEAALRQSNAQNQQLAGRLIHAQELERARIARELHDDVGQRIASLSIGMGTLRRRLGGAPVHDELASLQRDTVILGNDLRSLSHELHPALLEHLGLVEALRARCEKVSAESGVEVVFEVASELREVSDAVALCFYRVAQEALRNVVNHAEARSATVVLSCESGCLAIRIADDGRGFDAGTAARQPGLGLISLDERVKVLGGTLAIDSSPRTGTIVSVTVPFGDQDATTTSAHRR